MNYKINLGCWGSVFAVPSDVVDKYIKIASGSSIKVLLYFLRHNGTDVNAELISRELSIGKEDVSDALLFWQQQGILQSVEGELVPAAYAQREDNSAQLAAAKAAALRTPDFSPSEIADTVKNDKKIDFLFKECEKLYGRPLRHAEQNALVAVTEHIGLPAEVALMMIDHCFSIGKSSPAYIKKTAMEWVENEVNTISAAEERICEEQNRYSAQNIVKRLFGIDRAMSQKEKDFSYQWVNDWGFSEQMIKQAYDINVNNKGKCSFPYIGKILENWHAKGYTEVAQVIAERKAKPDSSSLDFTEIEQQILESYKKGD